MKVEKNSRVRWGEGRRKEGGRETGTAAPLRLPRRQLWPERGALTSAVER